MFLWCEFFFALQIFHFKSNNKKETKKRGNHPPFQPCPPTFFSEIHRPPQKIGATKNGGQTWCFASSFGWTLGSVWSVNVPHKPVHSNHALRGYMGRRCWLKPGDDMWCSEWGGATLSTIIMVQWKMVKHLKGTDPIGGSHFSLNHDSGRKGEPITIPDFKICWNLNSHLFPVWGDGEINPVP